MSSKGKAEIKPAGENNGAAAEAVPLPGPAAGTEAVPAGRQEAGADADQSAVQTPVRRRWRWRLLRGCIWMLTLLSFLGAGAIYFGIGTRLDAPDWVRSRVEARIERHLNGLQIEFGAIHVVVNEGLRPRVSLKDVVLRHPDGTLFAQLADAQASLAMRPLLRGKLQPKRISLSGLFAALRRNKDGSFAISFANGGLPSRQAGNLAELIEQWDSQLQKPVLAALAGMETSALTLSYTDDRLGRAWTLDGGRIGLKRDGSTVSLSAVFSVLSGRGDVGAVEASYTSEIGSPGAEFGVLVSDISSEDIALQSPALGWLGVLRAPISGSLRGEVFNDGGIAPVQASLRIGEGVIQPAAQTRPVPITGARSYFTYYPAQQVLKFSELSVQSGWGSGVMQGQASLAGVQNGQLTGLVGQLRFSDLELNPRRLFETPVKFPGVDADFDLSLAPFRLRLGEMLVRDGDSRIHFDGDIGAGPEGWDYDLNGSVDQVSVQRVKELWPEPLAPNPRLWVRENLMDGQVRKVGFHMRGRGSGKPFVSLDLAFDGAEVVFQKFMPPVQDASGQLSLYGQRFVVTASGGAVTAEQGGEVEVAGTSFIIPDVSAKDGTPGIARIMARGSATAALSLLNREPLQVMDKAGLPVDLAEGLVEAEGTLALPLQKQVPVEEILYHYQGRIRAVESGKLVPGHVAAAPVLEVTGDQSQVRISGKGSLSGVPVTASWQQRIGKGAPPDSRVEGTIELSAQAVEAFNLGLPRGTVFGKGQGQYSVDLAPDAPPRLELQSDLAGLGLRIPEISWRKGEAAKGELSVSALLGKTATVEQLQLQAPGLAATGQVTTRKGGGLDQAVFSSARAGDWFRGSVTFRGRGAAPPAIEVTGGRLDLNRSPFSATSASGSSSGGSGSSPITLRLQNLQVTDSIGLQNFQGRFSNQGGMNGEFTARLNGQTPVAGTVVPQNGGTAARIRANDAGGVFRSAGIFEHGRGGRFDMTLIPADKPGEYDGKVNVRNIRVQNAPSMAAILNAISLIGLLDEMTGQGILFTSMEGRFRLGASHLILHQSSAVGPSMGLSLDGNYDLNNSRLNMRGVISPIYLVNAIGRILAPRDGEGLIGFTFTLRGTADDPAVSVNPLAGLAPGFLREIFRGPAPKVPGQQRAFTAEEEAAQEERRQYRTPRGADK
ncbi:AsmA-like C-terminal region-containing protein [Leisingera aquimarina]|uniref:YhdP family protein n=1 Tax=Leisingera aquimarina TaxID=476529 RepID=UPI00040DA128|nr:AsmA-like C-terminal region-containing protein [Leisingera aquimarina]